MNNHGLRSRQRKRAQGLLLLFVLVVLIAVGFYYQNETSANIRPLNAMTECPTDGKPPTYVLVVLIDTTDPLSAVQQTEIMDNLDRVIETVPQYGKVQLFAVGPAGNSMLRPLATVCNPGSGRGESGWYSNPALKKKRWTNKFLDPLQSQLSRMLNTPPAETSPILECIQNVAASVFDAPTFDSVPKQLIIASDMVQNSAEFSQYHSSETFDQFKRSRYYLIVRPQLDNVQVSVLYLRRENVLGIQGKHHIEFWQDYFVDAGARFPPNENIFDDL